MSTSYGMGQYRYSNSTNECGESVTLKADSVTSASGGYKDLILKISSSTGTIFQPNEDYYVQIAIPRDLSYAMELTAKLVNSDSISNIGSNYQFIGEQEVSAVSANSNVVGVAYYAKSDKLSVSNPGESDCLVGKVIDLQTAPDLDKVYSNLSVNQLYRYVSNGLNNFYIINSSHKYVKTTKVSFTTLSKKFTSESSDSKEYLEFIFRVGSEASQLNSILIEMTRTTNDMNISQTVNGTSIAGRYINPSQVSVTCLHLTNLIDTFGISKVAELDENSNPKVSKIAVWGNPGLAMCINGEGMRVGPSGQFSFDATSITSIGVAAISGMNSMFTIDYQYPKANS